MKISKKLGIALFSAVLLMMAVIIIVHHNPHADPQDELIKKVISCAVIVAMRVPIWGRCGR